MFYKPFKTNSTDPDYAPMAEWLRSLIFSALNHCHLAAVGSSLARVTYETSKVLLAGGQVFLAHLSRRLTR